MRCIFKSHYRDYKLNEHKIDDSEGMCGSELGYDTCWSRICNPDRSHVVKDLLRGLLVLIVLAIVVTVVFLLCYFLIQDIKEEKKIDELIDIFSDEIEEGGESSFRKEVAIKTTTTTTEPDGHDMFSPSPPVFTETLAPHVPESSSHGSLLLAEVFPTKLPETDEDKFSTGIDYDSNFYDVETVNAREIFITEDVNVCDSLRLPICSSMPWAVTTLPNWVNNNNVNELYDSVKYFENTIIKSQCSDRVLQYSCAILEPACGPNGIALPPCKSFCEDVARSCGEFLINGNKHNSAFQCDRYPDSTNPNTCNTVKSASPKIFNKPSLTSEPINDNIPSLKPTLPIEQPAPRIIEISAPVTTEITTTIAEVTPDEETTTELPVFICDETMFLCNDGSDCLQQESICDGIQHCLDNTDEENCTKPECDENQDFSCTTTNYCIPKDWVCDGADDCKDNSDEENCPAVDSPLDPFDDERDGDNFIVAASDHIPGVFNVVPADTDYFVGGGGNVLPPDHGKDSLYVNDGTNSDLPFLPYNEKIDITSIDSEDILSQFSKFGGEPERTFGINPPEDSNPFSNIDHTFDESLDQPSIPINEVKRPNRPSGFRIRRPTAPPSVPEENMDHLDENKSEENDKIPQQDIPEVEEPEAAEESHQDFNPIRRRRPGIGNILARRQNFRTRNRQTANPNLTNQEELEDQTQRSTDRRRNRIRVTSPAQFESFKEASTESTQEVPANRPISIIRRRPNAGARPTLAAKVENFLKDKPDVNEEEAYQEAVYQEEGTPIANLAQPITVPEQIIPSQSSEESIINKPVGLRTTIQRSRIAIPKSELEKDSAVEQKTEQDYILPENYGPSPDHYEPRPENYVPMIENSEHRQAIYEHMPENSEHRSVNYEPKHKNNEQNHMPENYETRFENYETKPEIYEPRPENYVPRPEHFPPRPEHYEPRPESYETRPENYETNPENYETRPENYETRPENYETRSENYEERPENFEERPENYEERSEINNEPQMQDYYNTEHQQQYYGNNANPQEYYYNTDESDQETHYRQPEKTTEHATKEEYDYSQNNNRRQSYYGAQENAPPFNYQLAASNNDNQQYGVKEHAIPQGYYHPESAYHYSRVPEVPASYYENQHPQVQQYSEQAPKYSQQTYQQNYGENVREYAFSRPKYTSQ